MRNFISGNDVDNGIGVFIRDTGTTKNVVECNFDRHRPGRHRPASATTSGVAISSGASGERDRRDGRAKAANVISGNNVDDGSGHRDRRSRHDGQLGARATIIGTNYRRHRPSSLNSSGRRRIGFGASENVIGGTAGRGRQLHLRQHIAGITISGTDTTGNRVEGNLIGTDTGWQRLAGQPLRRPDYGPARPAT